MNHTIFGILKRNDNEQDNGYNFAKEKNNFSPLGARVQFAESSSLFAFFFIMWPYLIRITSINYFDVEKSIPVEK